MNECGIIKESIVCGLYNLGNSCYLNAVIQVLANQQRFLNYLYLQLISPVTDNTPLSTNELKRLSLKNFLKLIRSMYDSEKSLKPIRILRDVVDLNPHDFSMHQQGDAAELLLVMLSKWEESFNSVVLVDTAVQTCPLKGHNQQSPTSYVPQHVLNELLIKVHKEKEEHIEAHEKQPSPSTYKTKVSQINAIISNIFQRTDLEDDQIKLLRDILGANIRKRRNSFTDFFQGSIVSVMKCGKCNASSLMAPEDFLILTLPIPALKEIGRFQLQKESGSDPQWITLQDCLESYCQQRTIEIEGSTLKCKICSDIQDQFTEKAVFLHLPEVLMISFKRFRFNESWFSSKGYGQKISTYVECPQNIDLSEFVSSIELRNESSPENMTTQVTAPFFYKLSAVINHHGSSLSKGHYTAYAYKQDIEKWALFNDHHIAEVEQQEVIDSEVYIAIYERTCPIMSSTPPIHQNKIPQTYTTSTIDLTPTAEVAVSTKEKIVGEAFVDQKQDVKRVLSSIISSFYTVGPLKSHDEEKSHEGNISAPPLTLRSFCPNETKEGGKRLLSIEWLQRAQWMIDPGPIANMPCYCCPEQDVPTSSKSNCSNAMSQMDIVFSNLCENLKVSDIQNIKMTPKKRHTYFQGPNKLSHGRTAAEVYVEIPRNYYSTLQSFYGGGPEVSVADLSLL